MKSVILWCRNDLRISDHPILEGHAGADERLIPVYIMDEAAAGSWKPGAASRWWLHHSLKALNTALGGALRLMSGDSLDALIRLIAETGADTVLWTRRYEPWAIAQDTAIKAALTARGITVRSFNGTLLNEPWALKTGSGGFYKVFTPYWKAAQSQTSSPGQTRTSSGRDAEPETTTSARFEEILHALLPLPTRPNWAADFPSVWTPGELGSRAALAAFIDDALSRYATGRDLPGIMGTSMLSPHLAFGEISPHQILRAVQHAAARHPALEGQVAKFMSEIGWREFARHLLFHAPHMTDHAFKPGWDGFPWRGDDAALSAWQRGQTGIPIVDAGMRQLWRHGWMHNRVRMIAASFLVKHLLIPWQHGARWFWDTLVDADLANNSAGWQWVAGCGADAAPYFRIFNPVLQGEKFDPDGVYVRTHVPELAALPARYIHKPWEAPAALRAGLTYPAPIIDLASGRARALAVHAAFTGNRQ